MESAAATSRTLPLEQAASVDPLRAYERATTHVRLLQEVAVAANEASRLEDALAMALDCVCRTAGWPLGHVYLISERDPSLLEPSGIWHDESGGSFAAFRTVTAETPQTPGSGLAGLVLADGRPHWLTARTAAKRGMPRAEAAAHDRLRSGFAFPVIVDGAVAAVLEFFSTEQLSPDEDLLEVTASIGGQLGRVIERKRTERALRQAETKYRVLVEQLPIVLYAFGVDDQHAPIYRSPQIVKLLRYTLDEWKADPDLFPKLLHDDDRARVTARVDETERTGEPFADEYRLVAKDGRVVWVRDENVTVFDTDGRPLYRQGFMQDITERRRADELLREAESRYRALVEQLPLTVYVDALDDVSSAIYMSPQIEGVLGYSVDEWLHDHDLFARALHPDDRARVLREHAESHRTGEPLNTTYRLVGRDGRTLWFHDESVVVRDSSDNKLYRQGFMLDITERRQAESLRELAEARYRSLVEQLPLTVYIDALDDASSAIYMSPQIEAVLGYTVDEWLGNRELFAESLHPDDRERVLAEVAATNASGEPFRCEYRLVGKDGRVVWFRDESVVIQDTLGNKLYAQGYMLDITSEKTAAREREHLLEQVQGQS